MIAPEDRICLYCTGLAKCPNLQDKKGRFDHTLVVTPEALRECDDWVPVRWHTRTVREQLYARSGSGSLHGLFVLPDLVSSKLELQEEEERNMTRVIDLASIITEDMTADERRYQLLHVTDDDGNVTLDDKGNPIPRNSHEFRFWAISDEYHVRLDEDAGMFWRAGKVLDYIIEQELEQGLIVKSRKGGKTNKAGKPAKRETKKMGRKVVRRTTKKAGGKKVSKKVGKTTSKKKVSKKTSSRPRRTSKKEVEEPEEGTMDLSGIEETLENLTAKVAELAEKVEEGGGGGGGEVDNEAVTDLQDITTNLYTSMINTMGAVKDMADTLAEEVGNSLELLEEVGQEFGIGGEEGEEGEEPEEED